MRIKKSNSAHLPEKIDVSMTNKLNIEIKI